MKKHALILGTIIGAIGIAWMVIGSNWKVCLGVALFIWGDRIARLK